jgi:hypothetical protein
MKGKGIGLFLARGLFLASALVLGACSAQVGTPQAGLVQFTVADLQGALADAQASGDQVGMACWTPFLAVSQVAIVGAAGTVQRARDLLALLSGPCAPIVVASAQLVLAAQNAAGTALLTAPLAAAVLIH